MYHFLSYEEQFTALNTRNYKKLYNDLHGGLIYKDFILNQLNYNNNNDLAEFYENNSSYYTLREAKSTDDVFLQKEIEINNKMVTGMQDIGVSLFQYIDDREDMVKLDKIYGGLRNKD